MAEILPESNTKQTLEKRNLEIKARISDLKSAIDIAESLSASYEGVLYQTDTYFFCTMGRLKLREIRQDNEAPRAELIYYNRPDNDCERWSSYFIAPVSNPSELKALLTHSNGLRGVVDKARTLYLWNGCRIHLDRVANLGDYLEFEVVFDGDAEDDKRRMAKLVDAFVVKTEDTIAGSYSDLLGL